MPPVKPRLALDSTYCVFRFFDAFVVNVKIADAGPPWDVAMLETTPSTNSEAAQFKPSAAE